MSVLKQLIFLHVIISVIHFNYELNASFFCSNTIKKLYLFELCVAHKNKQIKKFTNKTATNSKRRKLMAHGKQNCWFKVDHQRRSIHEPFKEIKIVTLKTQRLGVNRSDQDSIDYKLGMKCT